ncbi:GNAT family N-acetyltransferase [Tropicibacter sp. R16_0]|uniref:GNAT family N-acetyltransferase n=1 Tax=Tropicibacter sp. R16_0 TaxID=2821102 RepID=UPI001ADCD63A|nr:GNAT family N-acetyltransferase [Tropicibacter sp. R16_0]MBO9452199.1 GNAT family N-acetyltransferase [Tropicibacter sp. R16_0]
MIDFELTQFQEDHLPSATALSTAVGWSHRQTDWAMLLPFSTGVVAQRNGDVSGTALRSDFGDDLSTINMVIVSPDTRGQGLGRKLMAALLDTTDRNIRLVATRSGRPLYEKLGFHEVGRLAQHQGVLTAAPEFIGAQAAQLADLAKIQELESQSFGGDRSALIDWLADNGQLAVMRSGGEVTGFAGCRRFGQGHVIGPVVAKGTQDAKALIAHHLRGLEGEFVRLDMMRNADLTPWLVEVGLFMTDQPPVMERGTISTTADRLAVFSQGLG